MLLQCIEALCRLAHVGKQNLIPDVQQGQWYPLHSSDVQRPWSTGGLRWSCVHVDHVIWDDGPAPISRLRCYQAWCAARAASGCRQEALVLRPEEHLEMSECAELGFLAAERKGDGQSLRSGALVAPEVCLCTTTRRWLLNIMWNRAPSPWGLESIAACCVGLKAYLLNWTWAFTRYSTRM